MEHTYTEPFTPISPAQEAWVKSELTDDKPLPTGFPVQPPTQTNESWWAKKYQQETIDPLTPGGTLESALGIDDFDEHIPGNPQAFRELPLEPVPSSVSLHLGALLLNGMASVSERLHVRHNPESKRFGKTIIAVGVIATGGLVAYFEHKLTGSTHHSTGTTVPLATPTPSTSHVVAFQPPQSPDVVTQTVLPATKPIRHVATPDVLSASLTHSGDSIDAEITKLQPNGTSPLQHSRIVAKVLGYNHISALQSRHMAIGAKFKILKSFFKA